jgi:hypothetical protein
MLHVFSINIVKLTARKPKTIVNSEQRKYVYLVKVKTV